MNDQFTKDLLANHGDEIASKLSARMDVTPEQSRDALSALSPLVLSALKRQHAEVGDSGIEDLLSRAGVTSDQVDNIDDIFEKGLAGHTSQTRTIFNEGVQEQTANALSQKLNIGGSLAKKLLPMLAPVILGMLMKKGGSSAAAPAGASAGQTSGIGGAIGSILDRDGDGSVIDDIAGMVLGGESGGARSQQRSGILQWILAFLFRKK